MSECHKCKYQAEIERLRKVCLACAERDSQNNHGQRFVSWERAGDSEEILTPAPDWRKGDEPEESRSMIAEKVPAEKRAFVTEILKPFWQMSFEEWVTVGGKVRGMSDMEIAQAVGWSKQRIWATRERVTRKWPTFGCLKTGFDGNHPPKGGNAEMQQADLFGEK